MIKSTKNQYGFGHLVMLSVLVLVAAVAFVGFRVYTLQSNNEEDSSITGFGSKTVKVPATIKTNTDLVKTEKAVDASNLDSDLQTSDLDKDVNDLL